MSTLEEKKAMRLKFMNALYEETDGDKEKSVAPQKLAEAIDLSFPEGAWWAGDNESFSEYKKVVTYLSEEGLVRLLGREPVSPVFITHQGVVEVERALENPDQPTRYFAPAATVIF